MTTTNEDPKSTSFGFAEALEGTDVAEWTPSAPTNDPKPEPDRVRKVAESAGYTSRESKAEPTTVREGQMNIRAPQTVIDEFRELGRSQEPKWPNAYLLQRALDALKRELASK